MPSRCDKTTAHSVVQLHRSGMSRRAIARALRISRNTVREILLDHERGRDDGHSALLEQRLCHRSSKLDPFREDVEELFRLYPNITAQRVYEILRAKGFDGGYTIVKTLVRRARPRKPPKPSLETEPREPGVKAECDWSPYDITFTDGSTSALQVFGYTLRYSTRKFYSLHERNDLYALMDGHVHAFDRFGGVAHSCKYDSQKPVVLRWEGNQPILNLRFVDFATYYEFSPDICRRRHPNDKPRVERSFRELNQSFFNGRRFRDVEDLKAQLTHWMDTIADPRPLKRMRHRSRLELFAEEQPLLRPLPRHHYDTAHVLYKPCNIEGYIEWDGNLYSLPYEHVTEILPVRVTENEVFIYKPDLTCIACHPRLPHSAQQKSVLDGHRPRRCEHGPDLDHLRCTYADMGISAAKFLAALEARHPRSAGYHARRVLALRAGYSTDDLLAALDHARTYGAFEHQAVERILHMRASPRRLDEYIAERTAKKLRNAVEQSSVEPRDLAEYDELPCHGYAPQPPGDASCHDDGNRLDSSMNE